MLRGALIGTVLVLPVSLVASAVEGWTRIPLFFALLVAFAIAGFAAGREVPDRRLTAGMLAGLGAVALWIPIRVAIWLVRDDDRGLVAGSDAVLRPGQVFTVALLACALGLVGGLVGGGQGGRTGR